MYKGLILFISLLGTVFSLQSQCFQIMDGNGLASSNPYFINCAPGTYTVFIQPNQALGSYTINWGDGTANSTGSSLVPPAFESHTYASVTDTFNINISSGSCSVDGVVVMERNPLASIQLPSGDDNFGCTPVAFRYINSSTQVSQTTEFVWDYGDGSPIENYDHTNLGDTLTHVYLPGIGVQSCDLEVTLTATNYCGSSTASFFPVKVWDLDEAQITPSATLLCYPDTIVSYRNTTIRNCYPEGNQSQRYEYWNFGDYWGKGYDSIIQWRPWNPPIINPPPIAYPGTGTYVVTLLDSSFCGIDDVSISITITDPPTAAISSNKDTICAGETVRFFSNSSGGANLYSWNFDQGAGWESLSGGTKNRTFNTAGNYTIRLAVGISGAQGCFDTASVDLVVSPGPITDFSLSPTEACDSLTTNITNLTSGAASLYRWDFGNGQSSLLANPTAQTYSSPGTYSIKLYAESSSGCKDSISKEVRVRQSPVADFSVTSVCLGQQAAFTDLSTFGADSISSWKWYFGDGDSSSQQHPFHAYNGFGNYEVILLVESANCWDSDTLQITVEAPPTAAFSMDSSESCSPFTINFTNQSSLNASSFVWDFGDSSQNQTGRDVSHTYTNLSNEDTTFVVRLIALTTFGCADTIFDTVRVFAKPQPSFTSNAQLDCGPVSVDFNNTTSGNSLSYWWDFGDGSALVNDTNPTHIFENKTLFISNYKVSLIAISSNGCRDTVTDVVTVYPEPNFSFTSSPDSGCSPLKVTFPSVVGAVNYSWNFGDGQSASGPTPSHTFVNNTTNDQNFQVRLIAQSAFGCVDTSYANVLVHPNPTAAFVTDTNKGCQPLPINIVNNSTGAIDYSWNFGDGSSSDTNAAAFVKSYENLTQNTNFHRMQLIVESDRGCKDTSSLNIEVHPYIEARFLSDSVGCSPLRVDFSNLSVGASSYQWFFGNTQNSTASNPQQLFVNNTNSNQTFRVSMYAISPQACQDSAFKDIVVYPKPEAIFTSSQDSGCQPLSVIFTNASTISDSCSWIFGDGSSLSGCSPSYSHLYTNTTSFFPLDREVELRVFTSNGCSDTSKANIKVKPEVKADFTSDSVGCSPFKVNFQNQSSGGSTYEWRFSDGGGQAGNNASHTFINSSYKDSIFTTELIVTSAYNCKDTLEKDILIHPKPLADFMVNTNSGCQPLPVEFSNNSIIADSCRWNFGDGSNLSDCSALVNHTYSNTLSLVPINYKAQLIVYTDKGCSDSLVENIEVAPLVEADFIADSVGCSPLRNQFRSQSFGAIDYSWDFGDGNSGLGMLSNHVFYNTGSTDSVYTVQLIASSLYNCNDTVYKDVLVHPTPIPDFSATPLSQTFPNSTVTLLNQSNPGNWAFEWDFDDSSYSQLRDPGVHQYNSWGKYFIELKASTDFCSDSVQKMVEIKVPLPIADFRDTASGCAPLQVSFENLSKYARAYEWDFGDGGKSNLEEPVYTYYTAGEYTVSLKAFGYANGLEDVVEKQFYIKVFKTPTAGFLPNKEKVFVPNDPLVLSNTSRDADNYFWDFGDGQVSTKKSPVHYYTAKGEYFISLIASSNNGCVDTFKLDIPVMAEGVGAIVVPNAFTPNPHSSSGGQVNRNAGIDVMNDVFYAKIQGAVKYELNIFNKWGELLFVSEDVNIGWDGYYKSELCQQDVYVWKIKAEFIDGTSYTKVGDLLLLR